MQIPSCKTEIWDWEKPKGELGRDCGEKRGEGKNPWYSDCDTHAAPPGLGGSCQPGLQALGRGQAFHGGFGFLASTASGQKAKAAGAIAGVTP